MKRKDNDRNNERKGKKVKEQIGIENEIKNKINMEKYRIKIKIYE